MNTRVTGFRTILAISVLLLVGCNSGGKSPDKVSPVIRLSGDNPQVLAVGEAYVELGATASDNRDGDLTTSIVVNTSAIDNSVPGTYQVSYNVRDAAGNTATTVVRTVIYEDRTPPVISLVGDDPQFLAYGDAYTEVGATATDNVDGDLTASITIDASAIDTSTPGDYTVTYDVTDAAGNVANTLQRTVTVQVPVPVPVTLSVEGDVKTLVFNWVEAEYTDHYRLLENADGHSGFSQVGDDIPAGTTTASRDIAVHLFDWVNAQYVIEACNATGCSGSDAVTATDAMLDTIGQLSVSGFERVPRLYEDFIKLSADGTTLAVGSSADHSGATGINGKEDGLSAVDSGAVYLFRFNETEWVQQAYIKASNADAGDFFGHAIAISEDGNTLAVGALRESSNSTGINGDQGDNSSYRSGAVYVFRFDGTDWYQQAYIKASDASEQDDFGGSVSLSSNGDMLAVGAPSKDRTASLFDNSGAAYVYAFDGTIWHEQGVINASNAEAGDTFGNGVSLSSDGYSLAVSAPWEAGGSAGINGDQFDNSVEGSGAVYLFKFDGTAWQPSAYVKPSEPREEFKFGWRTALSGDGNTLVAAENVVTGDGTTGFVHIFQFDGVTWGQTAYIEPPSSDPAYLQCLTEGCEPEGDLFGIAVSVSEQGDLVLIGSPGEAGRAVGINGDPYDLDSQLEGYAGAAYLYRLDGSDWNQSSYIKATEVLSDYRRFGYVAISADGETAVVGATGTQIVYLY